MIFEKTTQKGIKDIGPNNLLKNESILEILEDAGGSHSDAAGYGVLNMDQTHLSWVLLEWKVQVLKRPYYNETLKIETWGREFKKAGTFRDFKVFNEKGELAIIGSSKWAMIDVNTHKITRITEDIHNKYKPEDSIRVFGDEDIEKIEIPEEFTNEYSYKIERKDIDVNNHLHNTLYLAFAYESLPEEVYNQREFDYFRVTYKKEIMYGDVITCKYKEIEDKHIVVLYNETRNALSAIVELKKKK